MLTYKTEAFLNSRYELRKNVMTGVALYRSKDSYDYRFSDLTKEAMNTMSIRALKAGLDSMVAHWKGIDRVRYRKKAFWEIIQDALPIKKKLVTIPELQRQFGGCSK